MISVGRVSLKRKAIYRGFFGFRLKSNFKAGADDVDTYRQVFSVPRYHEHLRKVARKITGIAWVFASIPLAAMYYDFWITGSIGIYLIYSAYEKVIMNPVFSRVAYEIHVSDQDPNKIKFRTYEGYFACNVQDLEPMMEVKEALFALNLKGRQRPVSSQEKTALSASPGGPKALTQTPKPDSRYFVKVKNDVNDLYRSYLLSDKLTKISMNADPSNFIFLVRDNQTLNPYFIAFTWGLTGLHVDRDQLMRIISGGTWEKETHFTNEYDTDSAITEDGGETKKTEKRSFSKSKYFEDHSSEEKSEDTITSSDEKITATKNVASERNPPSN